MNVFHPDPHTVYINTWLKVGMRVWSFENVWIPQTVKTKHNTQVLFSYRHLTKAERSAFPKDAKLFSSAKYAPGSSLQYSSYACFRQPRVHAFDDQVPVIQKLDSAVHHSIRKTKCPILWIVIYQWRALSTRYKRVPRVVELKTIPMHKV